MASDTKNKFPLGPPQFLITEADLARLVFENGKAYLLVDDGDNDDDDDGKEDETDDEDSEEENEEEVAAAVDNKPKQRRRHVGGLLQCAILPPQTMLRPFLTIKMEQEDKKTGVKTEKSLSVLCRTCAERQQKTPCQHTVQQRCLVSVWTILEIAYSISLGYEVS